MRQGGRAAFGIVVPDPEGSAGARTARDAHLANDPLCAAADGVSSEISAALQGDQGGEVIAFRKP